MVLLLLFNTACSVYWDSTCACLPWRTRSQNALINITQAPARPAPRSTWPWEEWHSLVYSSRLNQWRQGTGSGRRGHSKLVKASSWPVKSLLILIFTIRSRTLKIFKIVRYTSTLFSFEAIFSANKLPKSLKDYYYIRLFHCSNSGTGHLPPYTLTVSRIRFLFCFF